MGQCDSCEEVKPNSSQDWSQFPVEEPTAISPVTTPTPTRTDWRAVWAQFAQPIIQLQAPRDMPAPGAGLAGLSQALTEAGVFQDVTGLAGNQENVIRTYLSNQENARAFAEMAQKMALSEQNAENSRNIMSSLRSARDDDTITGEQYTQLVRDHLGQMIDGGARQSQEEKAKKAEQPSLTKAAVQRVEQGDSVRATRTETADGVVETVDTSKGADSGTLKAIFYDVPLVPQPNKTSCWAAAIAMIESYRRSQDQQASVRVTATELADELGYSLDQSYTWDRLETFRAAFGLETVRELTGSEQPTPLEWHQWLNDLGPLYVTVDGDRVMSSWCEVSAATGPEPEPR